MTFLSPLDVRCSHSFSATADAPLAGRKSKGKPSSSGTFADSLQAQWSADRAKKGDYKRNRALARAEAQEAAPWASKKSSKAPSPVAGVNSSDVATINHQIREWLMHQIGKPALSLPPMSKKSRVAVHLLGEVYGLKTKSLGKGSMRFPVLERGSKSGVFGVDERRVQAIIATAEGDPRGAYGKGAAAGSSKARGKMGGLWAALEGRPAGSGRKSGGGGGGGGGNEANRNREGAVVGQGADKLGEGNVGYELLKRMGHVLSLLIPVANAALAGLLVRSSARRAESRSLSSRVSRWFVDSTNEKLTDVFDRARVV